GQASRSFTGILSQAHSDSLGNAGSVEVSTTGSLSIVNGGEVSSRTFSSGDAGTVKVSAGSIAIDGQGDSNTGIMGDTLGTGNAGTLDVTARENLALFNGGEISSHTFSSGDAGTVKVRAGSIAIDGQGASRTGIMSDTFSSTGNAGSIEVSVTQNLALINGGAISSNTFSSDGDAGTVKVRAGSITIDGQGTRDTTGILSVAGTHNRASKAGIVEVSAAENLSIVNGGQISSSTSSSGNAGTTTVRAGSIAIDGQGSSNFTGILSQSKKGSTGNAGSVEVSAKGNLSIVSGGQISTDAFSSGDAGTVRVSADSIAIEGHGNFVSFNDTGILSRAAPGSTGEAGSVEVSAKGNLSIVNGGQIASRTFSSGDAGTVRVSAGSIAIDGQESGNPTGIFSETSFSTGNAGSVEVLAIGNLSIVHGGKIASDNVSSPADSGTVTVSAGRILIDGQGGRETGIFSKAEPGSGNAGSINVSATGALSLVSGGEISADTLSSSGHAGTVKVRAGSLAIDSHGGSNETGIFSRAKSGTGSAGSIEVTTTGGLSLLNGGAISSSTFSAGTAGSVTVLAGTLLLDGDSTTISAAAAENSSGQTGLVSVAANDLTLSNAGHLSIENNANVEASVASALKPTSITVTAPRITLLNGLHAITTESTGNVAAGNIRITASDTLQLDPSGITTTAFEGNGGAIDITAGLLRLDHSQITTSVNGRENGNGGNIRITADSLILNTGFIQANTAAANASGGDVSITTQNLVASGNTLFLGGSTPHTFQPGVFGINVIQAAAPTGISGTVQISTPKLDVTSSLIGLDTRLINAQVARRLCENTRGSSLVPVGRGGLPLGGADFLSPGQISGIGFVTSPSVSLPTVRASLRTNAFTPCLAAL
uniref:beta strand repeat-containing protein n=1 Tax=Accumulibacter sp. TaxID=2053492 RepID=UPI0025843F8E